MKPSFPIPPQECGRSAQRVVPKIIQAPTMLESADRFIPRHWFRSHFRIVLFSGIKLGGGRIEKNKLAAFAIRIYAWRACFY